MEAKTQYDLNKWLVWFAIIVLYVLAGIALLLLLYYVETEVLSPAVMPSNGVFLVPALLTMLLLLLPFRWMARHWLDKKRKPVLLAESSLSRFERRSVLPVQELMKKLDYLISLWPPKESNG